MVNAGLLPHLSDGVIAVYAETTAADTVNRMLRGLRKRLAELSEDLSLVDKHVALRRGQEHKVLRISCQAEH